MPTAAIFPGCVRPTTTFAGERLNEAVNRAWNRCLGAWKGFDEQRGKLPATDSGTTLTRERWLLVLFQELGFGRLPSLRGGITGDDGSPSRFPTCGSRRLSTW